MPDPAEVTPADTESIMFFMAGADGTAADPELILSRYDFTAVALLPLTEELVPIDDA